MRKSKLVCRGISFCLLVTILSACASTSQPGKNKVRRATAQTGRLIASGHYKQALELCNEQFDGFRDKISRRDCIETGERIRHEADSSYQGKKFSRAGTIYKLLLESNITDEDTALSFNKDYLEKQLKTCSKSLLESGISQYREDKLAEAITLWEQLITFDPDNSAAIKAIRTARRQLETLRNAK